MTQESQLGQAMLRVQQNLPKIEKSQTATVKSEKGQYSYAYADLPDVSAALLPLLNEHGLVFMAEPNVVDGEFVLTWELLHVESGESRTGNFPIPKTTSQQMGSAITYARRYTLCSVTGLAPDEDDDGAAASAAPTRQGNGGQRATQRSQRTPGQNACADVASQLGLAPQQVFDWFQRRYGKPFNAASEEELYEHASFMEDNPPGVTPAGDYGQKPPF